MVLLLRSRPLLATVSALIFPVAGLAQEALEFVSASSLSPRAGAPVLRLTPAEEPPAAEHLFGDWQGVRPRLAERGLEFSVEYFSEVLGNVSGGLKRGAIYDGLLKVAVDLDLEKLMSAPGTQFHVSGLYPHGRSLSEHYVGDLFTLGNLDAPDEPRLFEFWLEQPLGQDAVTLRLGAMAADEEFAFTEQGGIFLNSAFGWPVFVSANAPAPAYPQAALGIRLKWQASETSYLQAAVYDGDPNPMDVAGNPTNPNGLDFALDEGALVMVEGGFSWRQDSDTALPGNAKLGVWYHTGDFDHLRRDDSGLSLGDLASSGAAESLHGNWGVYLAAEQTLWREREHPDQVLGVFTRLGGALSDRSPMPFCAEIGVTRTGLIPGRDGDTCGIAAAYGRLSDELRQLAQDTDTANGTETVRPDYEVAIEAAYTLMVRPGWALQPCVQYIVHPGGSAETDNALVLGLRSCFDF